MTAPLLLGARQLRPLLHPCLLSPACFLPATFTLSINRSINGYSNNRLFKEME